MIPTIVARGVQDAFELLHGVADRAGDASDAWDAVADDVFAFQRKWWLTGGGGTWGQPSRATAQRDARSDRDPRMMHVTDGLEHSASVRGAQRQQVTVRSTYLFIEVTHGLAGIHEAHGREVLGTPPARDVDGYARRVADFILTGEL